MTKLTIDRAHKYLLKEDCIRILKGKLNVYVTCEKDGKIQGSVFVKHAESGDIIPPCNYKIKDKNYVILVSSSYQNDENDKTIVEIINATNEHNSQFLQTINTQAAQGTYEEIIGEIFEMSKIEDSRNIYASQKLNEYTVKEITKKIIDEYSSTQYTTYEKEESESALFCAIYKIFDYSNIEKVDERLVNKDDNVFKQIDDYSTLSRVLNRQVTLEDGWENTNIGPILLFLKDTNEPVACIPKKSGVYHLYSEISFHGEKLTKTIAKRFKHKAVIFYRPLPNKPLDLKEALRFSLKAVSLKDFAGIVFFGLLAAIISLFVPKFTNAIYGIAIPDDNSGITFALGIVLIAALLAATGFALVRNFISFGALSKMKYALQAGLYGRLFNLRQSFINKYTHADLSLRAAGASSAFDLINTELINVTLTAIFSLVLLFVMFSYYVWLSVVSLIMVAFVFAILFWIVRKEVKRNADRAQLASEKTSMLFGLIKGVAKLRVANAEIRGLNNYMNLHIKSTKCTFEISKLYVYASSIFTCFTLFANIIIYSIAAYSGIASSTANLGSFLGFTTAFTLFSVSVLQLPLSICNFSAAIPYLKRLEPILQETTEHDENQKIGTLDDGEILIDGLSFTYGKEFPNVLNNIDLHIKPGEYLGIVGKSGCGKTTLMNLLLGFESPTTGKIYYDNQDFDYLDKCQMRQKFGVVLQDGDIIPGSIFENVTITKPDATMQEALDAIETVGLKRDVESFPMGMHTLISSESDTISGGQKQRILIARSIINKPKIIFMDEATSALDNATQSKIIKGLAELNATRVVVAHRLSTVIDCDRIIVIDEGRVAESGDYESLVEKKGLFWSLVNRQVI